MFAPRIRHAPGRLVGGSRRRGAAVAEAQGIVERHIAAMRGRGHRAVRPAGVDAEALARSTFVPPTLIARRWRAAAGAADARTLNEHQHRGGRRQRQPDCDRLNPTGDQVDRRWIARTRRWRVAHYGRLVRGISVYPRKHRFPDVCSAAYSGFVP
jgi:hypothetical protein